MKPDVLDTREKARQLNLDANLCGAFAEIGSGQEVARWFFRIGGSYSIVAKATSVCDATLSDALYSFCEAQSIRERLIAMLDQEYASLCGHLNARRGKKTCFFAFANIRATPPRLGSHASQSSLALRFQTEPQAEPSQILFHVQFHDKEAVDAQEAVGILGVNLIHGARHLYRTPDALLSSLLDHLTNKRIELSGIEFSGTTFANVDNRLLNEKLSQVRQPKAVSFRSINKRMTGGLIDSVHLAGMPQAA